MTSSLIAKCKLDQLGFARISDSVSSFFSFSFRQVKLFTPHIWQQTVRHRGKFSYKFPKPRHDIARFLEEITKPEIIKEIPNPVDKCVELKKSVAKALKFGSTEVNGQATWPLDFFS